MDKTFRVLIVSVVATAVILAGTAALVFYFRPAPGAGDAASSVAGQGQAQPPPPQFAPMQLQAQYAGPLASTIIQRWRDPVDGTICYIYLPVVVHHTPAPSGYVQYGSNSMGSISCLHPPAPPAR